MSDLISRSTLIEHIKDVPTWIAYDKNPRKYPVGMYDPEDVIGSIENAPTIDLYGTWIPCSERLPKVETEVWITAKRRYSDGTVRYITTTAIYEDGTMLEEDSEWFWHDLDGEYDEEHDCYIIPEGWWEYRHYHRDEEYDNLVDDEVIAWMPLPEQYRGEKKDE